MLEQNFKFEENNKVWLEFVKYKIELWNEKYKDEINETIWTKDDRRKYSEKINGDISSENITPYKYQRIKILDGYEKKKKYILRLEEFINKPFSEITFEDYSEFLNVYNGKLGVKEKVRRFLFDCLSVGIFKNNDKDFLIHLLPDQLKEFVKRNFM